MNKAEQLVYDNFRDVWFDNNIVAVDHFFHNTVIVNSPFGSHIGTEGKKELIKSWLSVFPKRNTKISDVTSNGAAFFLHWECSSMQRGTLFGVPPTGHGR